MTRLSVPPGEPKPGLELGDLGATHRDTMRRRAIELNDRAIALLTDEADMGNRHNMAAVHTDEQAGIELGLGLRNRPRAHALAGTVMDPRIVSVGPHAADIRRIDKVGAVGALDRKPDPRCGARRPADAAQWSRNHPLGRGRTLIRFGREYAGTRCIIGLCR